jgi:hypothetical protein
MAILATFDRTLYVKVLIFFYYCQPGQDCQSSLPRKLAILVGNLHHVKNTAMELYGGEEP